MNQLTVYKASAGSGKTFTLAAEYIARLLEGEPGTYRHILAVTFTNKATAEMKERILQRLWDLSVLPSDTQCGDNDFLDKLRTLLPALSVSDIRTRAGEALHALTHDYDRFHVETIDSFFQSLLSNLAHELGLAAGFKVDLDDREAIAKAVDRLMEKLPENPQIMKWVLSYIQERIEENKRWDITAEVNVLARELMKERFMHHDKELQEMLDNGQALTDYRNQLGKEAEAKAKSIKEAADIFDQTVVQSGGYENFSNGERIIHSYIKNLQNSIFDKEPSDSLLKRIDDSMLWLKKADQKKADKVGLAEKLRELLAMTEELREKGADTINSCQLSLRHINPLRLLNEISRELNAINQENNRFMLAKTPQLFDALVEDEDASFVFEKAGTTYQHVMIDEFQDTSTLQWKNFKKLLVENMASGNGCLLVGDVKQSIYRFRGGDWGILNRIDREFKNGKPVINNLAQNFRSTENVISFNNAFFPVAAGLLDQHGETGNTISRLYADVAQEINSKAGGKVRICLYENKKRGESDDAEMAMADDLARQIISLHEEQGLPYSKIAILVRFNKSAGKILSYFAKEYPQLPLISDEAFLLEASPAVQLLVHALRCLKDDNDTIARAYVARTYRNEVLGEKMEWTAIVGREEELLPEGFRAEHYAELQGMPLYELCEHLVAVFALEGCKGAAPYLFSFLDQVLSFLEDNPSDIGQFLTFWEESLCRKAVPAGEVEGVRILTIHKSKGLAFHTVLLPYCDWSIEKEHLDSLLWCEPKEAPYNKLPLVPIPLSSGKKVQHSIYAEEYNQEHLQKRIENLNLLYVAFTRAQQNLYIWARGAEQLPAQPTIGDLIATTLSRLSDQQLTCEEENGGKVWTFAVEVSAVRPRPKKAAGKTPHNPLEIRPETEMVELHTFESRVQFMQSNNARKFLAEPDEDADNVQENYISQGKLLHQLFANIRTLDDIDRVLLDFEQDGLIRKGKAADALRLLIDKRMENPLAASWFDGSWKLFNECTILSRDGAGHLRIQRPDRVMTRKGETVVVDFKFGKPRQSYHEQVAQYAALLQRMGYPAVKAYLWYVYTGEVVQVV